MNKLNRMIIALMLAATTANISAKTTEHQHHQPKTEVNMQQSVQKIQVVGKKFKANFGGKFVFQLDFHSGTEMTFTPILDNGFGTPETVRITMVEIRPNVYMVSVHDKNE